MAVPADWDFSNVNWILDTSRYVSAPSSLRLRCGSAIPGGCLALCKHPGSLCLPQARLATSLYSTSENRICLVFRNQAPAGSSNWTNCYRLYIIVQGARLIRRLNNVDTQFDEWANPWLTYNTWHQLRLSWWTAYNNQNVKSLAIRTEYWDGAKWVIARTSYDPLNMWEDSAVNRCGVAASYDTAYYMYFDDTEIWKPGE